MTFKESGLNVFFGMLPLTKDELHTIGTYESVQL
jgi:hypothetical protein